ncbi:hypothetical protein OF83DRAFT_782420 [Amylostereum chailletii]|nr:hypothetical protein OF83DRAFT_782420 [Amylostereum chailletii]
MTAHTSSYGSSSPILLSAASRKASDSSDSYSGPSSYGSSYPTSYDDLINSPAQYPTDSHLQMIASPFPLHSQQDSSSFVISPPKLSPVTPNIFFTPSISPRKPYTPGTSPIEHSPKPFRRLITMERKLESPVFPRRFDSEELDGDFDDALLSTDEDEDDTGPSPCDLMAKFVQSDEDEDISASPANIVYFQPSAPRTSGPPPLTPRANSGPAIKSAFSSPLSSCSPSSSEGSQHNIPRSPPKVMRKITQLPGRVVSGRMYHISPEQPLDLDASPARSRRSKSVSTTRSILLMKRSSVETSPSPVPFKKRRILDTSDDFPLDSRSTSSSPPSSVISDNPTYPQRTFPPNILINPTFALFYRRFPVSSFVVQGGQEPSLPSRQASANYNPPRTLLDLYTPRFTRGIGRTKVGACPICAEKLSRGGEGRFKWLSMKFSAFNYHMQYAHGISSATGRPFSPPTDFRTTPRPKAAKRERTEMVEGRCHKCKKWIPLESVKEGDAKVMELFWWKHAATCHQGSTIDGEGDVFISDAIHMDITKDLQVV